MTIKRKKMAIFQAIKITHKKAIAPPSDSEIIAMRKKMQNDYLLGQNMEILHTFYEIKADGD